MEFRFIDAQKDQNDFAPHLIIIRDNATQVIEYEFYAKPVLTGSEQPVINLPDNKQYSVELINPNLFESIVTTRYLYFDNVTNNYVPISLPVVAVNSGSNNIIIVNPSSVNNNLLLETTNNGVNINNITHTVVGSVPIQTVDLDGNSLGVNESIFSKLTFKKIIDNSLSSFQIFNKKIRKASGVPNTLVNFDTSQYVPYLPKYTANSCIPITNLVINGLVGGETPNNTRVIGITYTGNAPSSFTWSITGQGTSILSGANTVSPEFKFGNSAGTISFNGFDCQNNPISATYAFTLNNLITPIISKLNETTIQWTNDATNTSNTKTLRVYNSADQLQSETVNTSGSNNITVQVQGTYKIKYSIDGINFSAYSNLLTFSPTVTVIPTVTTNPTSNTIEVNTNIIFTFTNYIAGSIIRIYKSGVYLSQVTASTYATSTIGDYTFSMQAVGFIESSKTVTIAVTNTVVGLATCANANPFSLSNLIYDYLNNNFTFTFNANGLTSAVWKIKLGTVVIDSGTISSFASSTKTIVTNVALTNNTYVFELIGVSCSGTAVSNFTVSGIQIGCTLTDLLATKNTTDDTLIDIQVNSTYSIVGLKYDLLSINDEVILANQPVINFSLLSGTTYKCQLNFADIFEGEYKIRIKNDSTIAVCSVVTNFNFTILSNEITTDILTGDCDFTNFILEQSNNQNSLTGSFNSSNIINSLLFDILDTSLQPLFENNPVEIVSSGSGIYNIKLITTSLANGTYIFKVKTSACNINSSIINYIKVLQEVVKSTTPVITFNYPTAEVCFTPDCTDGDVKIYINNVLFYEPITKTSSGVLYKAILEVKIGDIVKVTVTCPSKLVSDFSNAITLTANTCVPISKSTSAVIVGNSTVNRYSNQTFNVDISQNFGGSKPFIISETTVVGGNITSGNNTNTISVYVTDSQQLLVGFKVTNCNGTHFVMLNKTVVVQDTTTPPEILIKPKIVTLTNDLLIGVSRPLSTIKVYNEKNNIVATVVVKSDGVFKVKVKRYKAYYVKSIFSNVSSDISNIFTFNSVQSCKNCNVV